jgi:hypothetical protein
VLTLPLLLLGRLRGITPLTVAVTPKVT